MITKLSTYGLCLCLTEVLFGQLGAFAKLANRSHVEFLVALVVDMSCDVCDALASFLRPLVWFGALRNLAWKRLLSNKVPMRVTR